MELISWPKALLAQEQSFHESALKWWFNLYPLVHCREAGTFVFC
jgi:hypothetical protein